MEQNKNIETEETMSQEPEDAVKMNSKDFNAAIQRMLLEKGGPKKLYRQNLYLGTSGGWREGYTKPLIEDRVAVNRAKEKNRRKVRRSQRKMA